MSHRPECYLMKPTQSSLDTIHNDVVFIGVKSRMDYIETRYFDLYGEKTAFHQVIDIFYEDLHKNHLNIEPLTPKLSKQFRKIFPQDLTTIKATKVDPEEVLRVFNKEQQKSGIKSDIELKKGDLILVNLFEDHYVFKKNKIKPFLHLVGSGEFDGQILNKITNLDFTYGEDYCYFSVKNPKMIEFDLPVYILVSTKKDNKLYEYTHLFFGLRDALSFFPEYSQLHEDTYIRLLLEEKDFKHFANQKSSSYDDRYIHEWHFKEGRHVLFFDAP